MNTKPFEYRKENKAYSIMIADSIPENSVNLAYVYSPKVDSKNIIVSKEQVFSGDVLSESKHSLYYPFYDIDSNNNIKRLQTVTSHYSFSHNNLLITDEFTLKDDGSDIPKPLYYSHILQCKINAKDARNIYEKSVPYTFGYEERTKSELEVKLANAVDKSDMVPLIDVLTIYDNSGKVVNSNEYKVRMIVDSEVGVDGLYEVIIYHSFKEANTFRVSYTDKDNVTRSEIIRNDSISTKASSIKELEECSMGEKKYYIKDINDGYEVYVKNEMYKINDDVREAFDFRYKILANVDAKFTSDNKAVARVGMIYLPGATDETQEGEVNRYDVRNFLVSLSQESGTTFPSYVQFYNPHPPYGYHSSNPHNSKDPAVRKLIFDEKYWEASLSYPQEYLNDYDLLIIAGYGEYDISSYTDRLKRYLKQGGKVLIDNSTNNGYNLLDLKFNDDNFFSYDYQRDVNLDPIIITNAKEWFDKNSKEYNRYYNLDKNFNISEVGYEEGGNTVAPLYNVNSHTERQWKDIIRFNGGYKGFGCYTYVEDEINRGKIYMSNMGLLKAYNYSSETSTRKVLTNMFICILEDMWVNTPWHYERIYHIDQLYDQEMAAMGYIVEAEESDLVAKRKILDNPRTVMSSFSEYDLYNFKAKYYFEVQEFSMDDQTRNKMWKKSKNITLPYSVEDDEEVYAYTTTPGRNDFDINSKEGYSKLNVKLYHEDISFKYIIRPFCYKWSDILTEDILYSGTGKYYVGYPMIPSSVSVYKVSPSSTILLNKNSYTIDTKTNCIVLNQNSNMTSEYYIKVKYRTSQIIQEKIYASNYTENEFTISSGDGVVELDKLSVLLPAIPDDEGFNNRDNVFYEVEVAYTSRHGLLDRSEDRVNLFIYDKRDSKFMFDADGRSVISYNDLHMMETVAGSENGDHNMYRYKTDDYYLIASTGYYSIAVSKKIFGVEIEEEKDVDIKLPANYNTNECWYPRIRNIDFTKKSFNKDDYVRWERMFGFKFDKEYIIKRLTEIFAGHADAPAELIKDDIIKNIVERLGNDEELTIEDIKVISEFFNVISSENLELEYNLVEYERQAWDPAMPVKKIYGEKAKYIDKNTITLSYENIRYDRYLNDGKITRDVVERISDTKLKINHGYILYGYGNTFLLEVYDIQQGIFIPIDPDLYTVDYQKGIITFKNPEILTGMYNGLKIYASYTYSTIQILKRLNRPTNRVKTTLTKMSSNWWSAPDSYIIGSSKVLHGESRGVFLNPVLYLKRKSQDGLRKLDVTEYEVDYDRGIFKIKVDYDEVFYDIYADYSFIAYEWLKIKDVDEATGVVTLSDENPIIFRDTIIANYYFEDKYIDYKGYINIDENGARRFIRLDLNPSRGHVCTMMKVVESEDKKITNDQFIDVPTSELIGKTVYFYILPKTIRKNSNVIKRNEVTLMHTFDFNELKLLQLQNPEVMYIGSIKIVDNYTRYDIEVMDSRLRGGGLREEYTKEFIASKDEGSLNWWDISPMDGDGFKANGIVVIKLPRYVLETFTQEEVELILDEHIACGVYPIIKYVDVDSVGDNSAEQRYAAGGYSNL